jgi:putative aldouronate transport system substrate-binding protein
MQMNNKNLLSVAATLTLAGSVLSACTQDQSVKTAPEVTKNASTQPAAVSYPLPSNKGITYWGIMGSTNMTNFFATIGETPFGKELEKKTGVNVKFTHPPAGQDKEQFNLIVASNELPDIIETNWFNGGLYPGGPGKAMNDQVILPLNDLIDKHAPNLKKMLAEDKELAKMLQTDDGKYFVFPMIRNSFSQVFAGPMIRKDWLDELGLAVPATIDEWEIALRAFKEKKGVEAPLNFTYDANNGMNIYDTFIGAYQTTSNYYIDDNGKVKYGPADKSFKDAVILIRKWYSEGLISRDFAVTDSKALTSKILSGQSGATVNLLAGGLGSYITLLKEKDPKANMVATPYPTLNKGEVAFTGQYDFKVAPARGAAITTSMKNPELAAQWLDYAYSKEGNMLYNFGIEGVSYTENNGAIAFTDLVNKDPKYTWGQVLTQYARISGPYSLDERYTKLALTYPQQEEAVKLWNATDAKKHALPPFLTPTEAESKELAKVTTALKSYKEEMFLKFILGKEPIDNFDKYVEQLNQIGLPKVLQIYQDSLDRYNKR